MRAPPAPPMQVESLSPGGSPKDGQPYALSGALAVYNELVPSSLKPRYAHLYTTNARLQQVHSIYGQFLGQPRPSRNHPVGGHGAILVGDYFQMPMSPAQKPRGPTYRRAPVHGDETEDESVLGSAKALIEQPLMGASNGRL